MQAPGFISPLTRYLAASYAILIAYACLHPWSGWQASGLPMFDYLFAPWPRYYRVEDLVVNVLGYIPLGFVLAPALAERWGRGRAVWIATLLGALLSLGVETTQNFLPTRVASNVDIGCNTLGAFIGALAGALWGRRLFARSGWIHRWRVRRVLPGRSGDLGLVLAALWMLTQLLPDAAPFGIGDLRHLLALPTPMAFDPDRFMRFESALVACGLLAIGLFARCMLLRSQGRIALPVLFLVFLGLAAKTLASASFFVPSDPFAWLTPGTQTGLLIGLPLLIAAMLLPPLAAHVLAGMTLLGTTLLSNLIPDNPYLLIEQQLLNRGNFLNFHGLTQLVTGVWPFLALAYLSALGLWRGEHLHSERQSDTD